MGNEMGGSCGTHLSCEKCIHRLTYEDLKERYMLG